MVFVKLKIFLHAQISCLISLDNFNETHSLKLQITLWHENDDKYFPEKQKMSIYEYLFL